MSNFKPFADKIAQRWDALSAQELYRTNVSGDDLWDLYLASFPEGTNPIFRQRTEHDGSYDKAFIRRVGNIVAMDDQGNLQSIWDVEGLEFPYDCVASELAARVMAAAVTGVFRIDENKLGHVETYEKLDDGTTLTWNHFNCTIAKRHFSKSIGEVTGELNTKAAVFKRGLEELSPEAFEIALDLIDSNSVYRGAEFRPSVKAFYDVQTAYLELPEGNARTAFVWNNIDFPAAKLRNTAVGTFLIDLTAGEMDVEKAVEVFGRKTDPLNYKRPTAIISQGMVNQAMKTIQELNLEPSLERRHARLSDVSVNDVLWVSNAAQAKMKGGLESLLAGAVQQKSVSTEGEDIRIEDFMANILPRARTLDVLLKNSLKNNLMSITAPVHEGTEPLFKWGNDFAWSYNGNIADSMREAVVARGGSVTGAFRFTHQWNYRERNASLMDLHVFMPGWNGHGDQLCHDNYGNNERVGWNYRTHPRSGGHQDVDYVTAAPVGYVPVENITFPSFDRMPDGDYICKIHNWSLRAPTEGGFKAEIEFNGQIFQYERESAMKHKEWQPVATVTKRGSDLSIKHHMPCGSAPQEVWGLKTEQFVPVATVMLSPNFWEGKAIGNKHWFFLLDGAKNPEPTRGIYNEFLRSDLEQHRKVFEVLGSKTKCEPTDDQLSGVGFSSTKSESVTIRVTGEKLNKVYNVQF